MNFLITGAAGYIGSHFVAKVLNSNNRVIGIDNFSNSSIDQIKNLEKINKGNFKFFECDILDSENLERVFKSCRINIVVHFAALKSVPDSFTNQKQYYLNNVIGTKNLLKHMRINNVENIIFSSSAAVYGNSNSLPLCENFELKPESFYGETKKICEEHIISETKKNNLKAIILRYFNPVGYDKSIYNFSKKILLNGSLLSNILNVINGGKKFLEIYGGDFNTSDGTPERDYIHINDLVNSHEISVAHLEKIKDFEIFNVGTGNPITVIEFIKQFSKINKVDIPYKIIKRRSGDAESSYTSCRKIFDTLSFKVSENIESMCKDSLVMLD